MSLPANLRSIHPNQSGGLFQINRRSIYLILLLLFTGMLVYIALLLPSAARLEPTVLAVGDVAPQDVLAPYTHSFESQVLTTLQREQAARVVPEIYTPADPNTGRNQRERLRAALAYIVSVRADTYANLEQKLGDLAALEELQLPADIATNILNLNDSRWQTVQQEAVVVLEQVLRATIRPEQVEPARQNIPALVNLSLTQEQAKITAALAMPFVTPNSFYDEAATATARQKASQAITPVERSFVANEVIIQRGQVISAADLEVIAAYHLYQDQIGWQELSSAAILTLIVIGFIAYSIHRSRTLPRQSRSLAVATLLFLAFLLSARLILPGHIVLPYVFPLLAYSLTLAALFGPEAAQISILPLAVLVSYELPNSLELTLFYTLSSLFGILILRRGQRLTQFFWAGVGMSVAGATIIIAYRLPQPTTDWVGITTLVAAAAVNGIISASISIILQFFLAQFLGITTALQLVELSRPDHPLLKFILQNAPGTYQHSLQVAILAEQAAERIGADPLLTRVGALYHDVGKAVNPSFFIENQLAGSLNPHHNIEPGNSASTIINHVIAGLEMARQHRLPKQIQDFISEHHGTLTTRYQYIQAVNQAGGDPAKVDADQFRYPGPSPRSRETALLMLADGCEARARADRPKNEQELETVIRGVVDDRIKNGELRGTDLTLNDLETIITSFVASLRGIYHPRIPYPTLEKFTQPNKPPAPEIISSPLESPPTPKSP